MTKRKKRIFVSSIVLFGALLGGAGYVYHRQVRFVELIGERAAEEVTRPHALPGLDIEAWELVRVGMSREQVLQLLQDASHVEMRIDSKEKLTYWEYGYTYGLFVPVPHPRAYVVYFDHYGKVASLRNPIADPTVHRTETKQ